MKEPKKSEFFTIRIPNDLLNQIQPMAESQERSVNQQCVFLLRYAIRHMEESQSGIEELRARLEAIEMAVAELQAKK